jgi:hypothetical protein
MALVPLGRRKRAQLPSSPNAYRLLRARGLIASLAHIVMKAADEVKDETDGTGPAFAHETESGLYKLIVRDSTCPDQFRFVSVNVGAFKIVTHKWFE